jgi:prepilin-type N-terminal cleavage/methylation domain-containing protein
MQKQGYTLSEILIALAILGICLAVSIPLLAQPRDQSQKKAVFKESINMLYEIMREGMASDELNTGNARTYFLNRLNAVKVCPEVQATDPTKTAFGGGCWTHPSADVAEVNDEAGVVLANGVTIAGFKDCCDGPPTGLGRWWNDVIIDWNGPKGPNVQGNDQLLVIMAYGSDGYITTPGNIAPCDICDGDLTNGNSSTTLFNEIFK